MCWPKCKLNLKRTVIVFVLYYTLSFHNSLNSLLFQFIWCVLSLAIPAIICYLNSHSAKKAPAKVRRSTSTPRYREVVHNIGVCRVHHRTFIQIVKGKLSFYSKKIIICLSQAVLAIWFFLNRCTIVFMYLYYELLVVVRRWYNRLLRIQIQS